MNSKEHLLDDIARRLVQTSPETPPDDARLLRRIEELAKNARGSWFGLLGLLVFVGVTLMGVTHLDFYGVGRETRLPLVGVSVPTRLFFWTAPVLTAAVYSYFHLYLMKLWDALGTVGARQGGEPLSEAIYPWLVADAALILRRMRRGDHSAPRRALAWISAALSLTLAWGFGLIVLFFAWWWSMPAREPVMTLFTAGAGLFAGWVGLTSLVVMWRRMGGDFSPGSHRVWNRRPWRNAALLIVIAVGLTSIDRTGGVGEFLLGAPDEDGLARFHIIPLAPINLSNAELARKPGDWLNRATALKDFRAQWCRREAAPDCSYLGLQGEGEFAAEWRERRAGYVAAIAKPNLSGRDLRGANLEGAFLAGVALRGARLEGANLRGAQLEEAQLTDARMQAIQLEKAWLEGANLNGAWLAGALMKRVRLEDANLVGADMSGAFLTFADAPNASFSNAHLDGADLSSGQFIRAMFFDADFAGADLSGGTFTEADFSHARMEGADLTGAKMGHANLTGADLAGANLFRSRLREANFHRATLTGANLHAADLAKANFTSARMEAVDLREADLSGANLHGAGLPTVLHNARLTGATFLNQRQLTGVIGNDQTILPVGGFGKSLFIETCWPSAPDNFEAIITAALLRLPPERHEEFRDEMQRDFICPRGDAPSRICSADANCE